MKGCFVFLFLAFAQTLCGSVDVENSIVKISQTRNYYNYYSPWNAPVQENCGGTGFVIEGNRIMTNAHVVANSVFLQVKIKGHAEPYRAYVEWIGHDCDLAILKLEDSKVLDSLIALPISDIQAQSQEEVVVLGYPMGGKELSVTKGIVSRTEVLQYAHGGRHLLCTQIDAPINPGNSGGPVFSFEGCVVGVAHQGFREGQNLGYMIPIPIIHHFLEEVSRENYQGFPLEGINTQHMENTALRNFYNMESDQSGVLVRTVDNKAFFNQVLYKGDVLLSIDGFSIENNGTVDIEDKKNIPFGHLLSQKFYGDYIDLEILRDGRVLNFSAFVDSEQSSTPLVPDVEYEKRPTYYILGGLVFQPLNGNFLCYRLADEYQELIDLVDLFYYSKSDYLDETRSEIIVLSRVLPSNVNVGYQSIRNAVISSVNGKKVKDMHDLIECFQKNEQPYHNIKTDRGVQIILDRQFCNRENEAILETYLIPQDRSKDLERKNKCA